MVAQEATIASHQEYDVRPNRKLPSLRRITRYGARLLLVGALTASCSGGSSKSGSADNTQESNPSLSVSNEPPTAVTPQPGPHVLLKGSHHREIEQFGTDTFTDYTRVYGPGPELASGSTVDVDCLATGPIEAAPSVKGKWYHIEGPAPVGGYYAAANTFENGSTSGPLSSQPAVDPSVPACPS